MEKTVLDLLSEDDVSGVIDFRNGEMVGFEISWGEVEE